MEFIQNWCKEHGVFKEENIVYYFDTNTHNWISVNSLPFEVEGELINFKRQELFADRYIKQMQEWNLDVNRLPKKFQPIWDSIKEERNTAKLKLLIEKVKLWREKEALRLYRKDKGIYFDYFKRISETNKKPDKLLAKDGWIKINDFLWNVRTAELKPSTKQYFCDIQLNLGTLTYDKFSQFLRLVDGMDWNTFFSKLEKIEFVKVLKTFSPDWKKLTGLVAHLYNPISTPPTWFILYGGGGNGKSSFSHALKEIFLNGNEKLFTVFFGDFLDNRFEFIRFNKRLLAESMDSAYSGKELNSEQISLLKSLSSSLDYIRIEEKNQSNYERDKVKWSPTLVVYLNDLFYLAPNVKVDESLARRLIFIYFPHAFSKLAGRYEIGDVPETIQKKFKESLDEVLPFLLVISHIQHRYDKIIYSYTNNFCNIINFYKAEPTTNWLLHNTGLASNEWISKFDLTSFAKQETNGDFSLKRAYSLLNRYSIFEKRVKDESAGFIRVLNGITLTNDAVQRFYSLFNRYPTSSINYFSLNENGKKYEVVPLIQLINAKCNEWIPEKVSVKPKKTKLADLDKLNEIITELENNARENVIIQDYQSYQSYHKEPIERKKNSSVKKNFSEVDSYGNSGNSGNNNTSLLHNNISNTDAHTEYDYLFKLGKKLGNGKRPRIKKSEKLSISVTIPDWIIGYINKIIKNYKKFDFVIRDDRILFTCSRGVQIPVDIPDEIKVEPRNVWVWFGYFYFRYKPKTKKTTKNFGATAGATAKKKMVKRHMKGILTPEENLDGVLPLKKVNEDANTN